MTHVYVKIFQSDLGIDYDVHLWWNPLQESWSCDRSGLSKHLYIIWKLIKKDFSEWWLNTKRSLVRFYYRNFV
jgi:hypothetical protein